MKTVAVFGAFDTKSAENSYLINKIQALGVKVVTVDMGVMGKSEFIPNVTASMVAKLAGEELGKLRSSGDRAKCLEIMASGAALAAKRLYERKQIDGAIAMGGGQGTYMAAQVMAALPIGMPKLLVSTIATLEHDQRQFEGINDTMVINPLVDVEGNNHVIRMIMDRAAAAVVGMVRDASPLKNDSRPVVGISMWGVTTPCVSRIEKRLQEQGYEVLVFHATGLGGRIMDDMAAQGALQGVIDVTLAEVGNMVAGGTFAQCAYRCERAGEAGIPQIVSFGGMDMVKWVPPETLPEKFSGRKRYMHNANLLFVRSSPEENREMGRVVAEKLNKARGDVTVAIPLRGISAVDKEGQIFYDPKADMNLFSSVKETLKENVDVMELDMHINDDAFADALADCMIEKMNKKYGTLI